MPVPINTPVSWGNLSQPAAAGPAPAPYAGPPAIDSDLSIVNHLVSASPSGVTLAAGAGAGAAPPAPVIVTCHDLRGQLTWGTGATPAAGAQVTATFMNPYATAPVIVLSPQNALTAALQLYVTNITPNGFTIACAVAPAAGQAAATYAVSYVALQ